MVDESGAFASTSGFEGMAGEEQAVPLTLFTDAYVIRGVMRTRQRRITDILNQEERDFVVIENSVMDEFGSRSPAVKADFAQVNLGSVLFAVADTPVEAVPELRTPKIAEQALVSIPPFRIVGRIHLLPGRDMHEALDELTGRFLPATDATYWSESVGEARKTAQLVAFNHARAQILAPHRDVDPWAGLDRAGAAGAGASAAGGFEGAPGAGFEGADAGLIGDTEAPRDPWRDLPP
jgi:hypothetical protein